VFLSILCLFYHYFAYVLTNALWLNAGMDRPEINSQSTFGRLMNPHNLEHPILTGVAIGSTLAYGAGIVISAWLHRSTHGGVEYEEPAKKFWRGANFLLTGMPKKDWVDHLTHHEYSDRESIEDQQTWNESRPEDAPEAPIEIFRDPYSVVLNGYLKVLFNTSGLHSKARKAINPFLEELQKYDTANGLRDREHWPKYLQRVDMEEANPEALRNKKPTVGIVAVHGSITLILGPAVAIPSAIAHVGPLLGMGGFVNAVNHTGQKKGFMNRVKTLLGKKDPVADENGYFAADIAQGCEFIVMGEPRHKQHHDNPQEPFLAGTKIRRDPPGAIIKLLVNRGLAKTPGATNQ
jgi:hypothetical protein